jgi:hypothetical protein
MGAHRMALMAKAMACGYLRDGLVRNAATFIL